MSEQNSVVSGRLLVYTDGCDWYYVVRDDNDNDLLEGEFLQLSGYDDCTIVRRIIDIIDNNLQVNEVVFCGCDASESACDAMYRAAKARDNFYLCNCFDWDDEEEE